MSEAITTNAENGEPTPPMTATVVSPSANTSPTIPSIAEDSCSRNLVLMKMYEKKNIPVNNSPVQIAGTSISTIVNGYVKFMRCPHR